MATLSPERLAAMAECVADGWPLIQIQRTHRVSYKTLRRHFPHYTGITKHEGAKLGAAARRATLQLRSINAHR